MKDFQKWLKEAEDDIKVAEYNLKGKMYKVAAFYSQQAAEKALKSLIIKNKSKLIKIHDLNQLSGELKAPENIRELCRSLNPAYTAVRYPDSEGFFSPDEIKQMLNSAKEVVAWVKKMLS